MKGWVKGQFEQAMADARDDLEDLIDSHDGLDHLRVRKRVDSLYLYSGVGPNRQNHARLTCVAPLDVDLHAELPSPQRSMGADPPLRDDRRTLAPTRPGFRVLPRRDVRNWGRNSGPSY